jgi:pimeloyl-ACP methyl ester carboxylesterase
MSTEAIAATALTAANRSVDIEGATLAYRRFGDSEADAPARDALRFVDALGLKEIDLLGFSLGGMVAQEMALVRPRLVRRIVLAGTVPRGGLKYHRLSDDVFALAARDELDPNRFISLFFSGSQESRAKAMKFLQRITSRTADRDEPTSRGWRGSPSRRSSPTVTTTRCSTRRTATCSPRTCRTRNCAYTRMPVTASSTSTPSSSPTTSARS